MFQFKQIAGMIAIHSLMLLGAATAWAGRGDVDPNYGEGGQLAAPPGVMLALPGDRLMIADGGSGEGFRVRMVDAAGQNVPTFGEGGIVVIDSSDAARTFRPDTAAFAPDGDLIFVGPLTDTGDRALLRIDSNGQPVLSFGSRGDGFVETALTANATIALAVDPDGKIVVVEGSWNPDFSSCRSTARLQRLLANGQPDTEFGGDGLIEIPNLELCEGTPVFGARADGGVIVGNGHTIVAVDAAGEIDPTFGVDGRLAVGELDWVRGLLLPDGGLLIFGSNDEGVSSNDTLFLKFDHNGQPDLNFGAGTGSVTVDLGAALLGVPISSEYIDQLALDLDGEHVVARLSISHADGSLACSGIARLTIDGTPDSTFGRNGVTCLNFDFALFAVQGDGAPLFTTRFDDAIRRLLPDNSPSPGLLRLVGTSSSRIAESAGTVTVTIERLAGRDGGASVDFATVYHRGAFVRYPGDHIFVLADSATAGSDYTATSGRLDWASGDDGQHTVIVRILNDNAHENFESFGVDFSEPRGGVKLLGSSTTVFITDDDEASDGAAQVAAAQVAAAWFRGRHNSRC